MKKGQKQRAVRLRNTELHGRQTLTKLTIQKVLAPHLELLVARIAQLGSNVPPAERPVGVEGLPREEILDLAVLENLAGEGVGPDRVRVVFDEAHVIMRNDHVLPEGREIVETVVPVHLESGQVGEEEQEQQGSFWTALLTRSLRLHY